MAKVFGRKRAGADGKTKGAAPKPVDGRPQGAGRARTAAPADDPTVDFALVGKQVASVLAAATEAADKMKSEAQTEAEGVRAATEEQAREALEAAKATAERADAHAASINAEAEQQSKELREQADEYAKDRRQKADAEAKAVLARAEKQASARERGAEERQRILDQSVVRTEERLRQLIAGLNELASGLAELVPPRNGDADANGSLTGVLALAVRNSHASSPEESGTS